MNSPENKVNEVEPGSLWCWRGLDSLLFIYKHYPEIGIDFEHPTFLEPADVITFLGESLTQLPTHPSGAAFKLYKFLLSSKGEAKIRWISDQHFSFLSRYEEQQFQLENPGQAGV